MKQSPSKKYQCILIAMANVLLASAFTACETTPKYHTMTGSVWRTEFHIVYDAAARPSDAALDDSVIAVMGRVEESLSAFSPTSLVSRINRGETAATDAMFRDVFGVSLAVNHASRGLFDPTVAPLVDLWGFGRQGRETTAPTDAQIDSALAHVGIADCEVDSFGRLLMPAAARQFNFSAVAKGYGCDCVADMLVRNGVDHCMVEIGGEIAVRGLSPRGGKWSIMIDKPTESADTVVHSAAAMIYVTDCGVATSGNYRNYREVDGQKVGHTISPLSGRPAVGSTLSATVVAPTCALADAYATAIMAMPPDSVGAMLPPDVRAMVIRVTPSGALATDYFNNFEALSAKN